MVNKKAKSKRCRLKEKYKVQRKVKEHKKKMRKLQRLNPHKVSGIFCNNQRLIDDDERILTDGNEEEEGQIGLTRFVVNKPFEITQPHHKKDPGIPNLFPYKEALLSRMDDAKERQKLIDQRQKQDRRARLEQRRQEYEQKRQAESTQSRTVSDRQMNQKKWYMKDLKQLLEVSDVILEVLDARDPLGCRCRKIEEMIQGQYSGTTARPKRIILVLNKIDLVPQETVSKWVKYLRREFACVAFKASTQQQKGNYGESSVNASDANADFQGGKSVGGQALLQIIKNYSRSHDIKTSITVGVIGYPNVGKSSLINSLKRARAVGVGAQPGFTKQCQLVKLDKQISIIDSPGVLFDADTSDPGLSLRNCLKVESIEDPVAAVKEITKRCDKPTLLSLYRIANFTNGEEFLYRVAQKRGKLGKGGVPDMPAAARCVLRDWNSGKIPFYTLPPEDGNAEHESVELVSSLGKDFDLEKINAEAIKSAGASGRGAFMTLESSGEEAKAKSSSSSISFVGARVEGNAMDAESDSKGDRKPSPVATKKVSFIDQDINPQANKAIRQKQQKANKKKKKEAAASRASSTNGGAYSFEEHDWSS